MRSSRSPLPARRAPTAALVLFGLALAAPGAAQERGFYLALAVPFESLSATFDKTVDNSDLETLAPPPRAGEIFREADSASGFATPLGFAAGYRLPLPGDGFFLAAEAEYLNHSGSVGGRLDGIGESPDTNELGELWPDPWELRRRHRYGVSVRFGARPGAFRGRETDLYLVGSLHRTAAEVLGSYEGCLDPTPCHGEGLTAGTDSREVSLVGWSVGAGLERTLFGRIALGAEALYSSYGEASWVADFPDVKITVPTTISAAGLSLNLRLLVRF